MPVQNPEQPNLAAIAYGLKVIVRNSVPNPDPDASASAKQLVKGQRWPCGTPAAWLNTYPGYAAEALKGSSDNWGMTALAAQLLNGTAAQKAQADDWAIQELTLQKTKYGWMRQEDGSVTYGYMHLDAVLVFFGYGSAQLKALAAEWLDLWKFWLVTAWDARVKRVVWVGKRSAEGGREARNVMDDLSAWLNGAGPFPAGKGTLDYLIVEALEPELQTIKARPLANPSWVVDGQGVDFYVGTDGVAVNVGTDDDPNTPAILAGSTVGAAVGSYNAAPAAPYDNRIREQGDGAKCVQVGNALSYTATRFFAPVTLRLPTAYKQYRLGNGSTQPINASTALQTAAAVAGSTSLPSPSPGSVAVKAAGSKLMLYLVIGVVVIAALILATRLL